MNFTQLGFLTHTIISALFFKKRSRFYFSLEPYLDVLSWNLVAWNGGVTTYISGDNESHLFQYYVGYCESSGVLIPHVPISIADIDDNDNFHQLCFSTSDEIIKISMMDKTADDPNL